MLRLPGPWSCQENLVERDEELVELCLVAEDLRRRHGQVDLAAPVAIEDDPAARSLGFGERAHVGRPLPLRQHHVAGALEVPEQHLVAVGRIEVEVVPCPALRTEPLDQREGGVVAARGPEHPPGGPLDEPMRDLGPAEGAAEAIDEAHDRWSFGCLTSAPTLARGGPDVARQSPQGSRRSPAGLRNGMRKGSIPAWLEAAQRVVIATETRPAGRDQHLGASGSRQVQHPSIAGELARIRQAELIAEAQADRLAKAARTADAGARTRVDVRALVALICARIVTRTRAFAVR